MGTTDSTNSSLEAHRIKLSELQHNYSRQKTNVNANVITLEVLKDEYDSKSDQLCKKEKMLVYETNELKTQLKEVSMSSNQNQSKEYQHIMLQLQTEVERKSKEMRNLTKLIKEKQQL